MFIYSNNLVDKLLATAKNREYVKSNPDLCHLLENPLLKDDTELAIRYNEYKLNYPDSAKAFVEYFFTHGPELDINTLVTWRKKILNDPVLKEEAVIVSANIETVWQNKQENNDYSWLGDLFECLSKPSSYINSLSPVIGTISDQQSKYNNKNSAGSSGLLTLSGVPSYMFNKIPRSVADGIMQITDLVSDGITDIVASASGSKVVAQEDPYVLHRAELTSGDLLSDIAAKMGDEFRILEFMKRYNPYDYEQNRGEADKAGTTVTDLNGKTYNISPNGNKVAKNNNNNLYSNNNRFIPNMTANNLIKQQDAPVLNDFYTPMAISIYNSVLTSDGKFYGDDTKDNDSRIGLTSGTTETGTYILPYSNSAAKKLATSNHNIKNGCASKLESVEQYFTSLINAKFKGASLPSNFATAVKQGWKWSELFVKLKFPTKEVILPIFDCGGGASSANKGLPWIDITAQFFVTNTGHSLGKILVSNQSGGKSAYLDVGTPMPDVISSQLLANTTYQIGKDIVGLSINGVQNNIVNGLFFFSEAHCAKYGLDPKIFGPIKETTE